MASAPKDDSVRSVIRSILVSNPRQMTIAALDKDFNDMEGYPIPFSKFGYRNLPDYLKSIPDTVTVTVMGGNPRNAVVLPVTTEKAAHVEAMVMKQRTAPTRSHMPRRPQNHVSAKASRKRRPRKSGALYSVPQTVDAFTLPASSIETNNNYSITNNPDKPRPKVNVPFFKRHVQSVKRRNDSTNDKTVTSTQPPLNEGGGDGSSNAAKNSALKTNKPDNPFQDRTKIHLTCLQEQINIFKKNNDYASYKTHDRSVTSMQPPQNEAGGDGCSVATKKKTPKSNFPDDPFRNWTKIDLECLQEQINGFKKNNDYASYKMNESTSQPSRSESNRQEAAEQEFGEYQAHSAANGGSQNSAKKKKSNWYVVKKRQQAALRRLSNMMDDSSRFSLTVAFRLRQMSHHQRHFAELLINRVLHYGNSGHLSSATDLTNSYYYNQQFNSYYNSYY